MIDPRDPSCREYAVNTGGKVVGVELRVIPYPGSKYALTFVELIPETAGPNNMAYVIVRDAAGKDITATADIRLCWSWRGWVPGAMFANSNSPGNTKGEVFTPNTYSPPDLGWLAIAIGNPPESDVLCGLGAPEKRHVGYMVELRERGAMVVPPVEPPPAGDLEPRVRLLEWRFDALIDWLRSVRI